MNMYENTKTQETPEPITANFNNQVDAKEFKFNFKKVRDENTGLETKRPSVELTLPVPSVEGIIAILETGGKSLELLLESVTDVIASRAREIVNEKEDINQTNFPFDQLAWEVIANLPKAERRGGGISKDTWEDFSKDYISVMPSVTGKTAEQVGNAAKILLNKFNAVRLTSQFLKCSRHSWDFMPRILPMLKCMLIVFPFFWTRQKHLSIWMMLHCWPICKA